MAYQDITAEQLDSVWQALNAPPPAAFAPPVNPGIYAGSGRGSGFLGSSNRFLSQIEKLQADRDKADRQAQATGAINQIDPLDPDYDAKIREIAGATGPEIFGSSGVRHVLSLADRQRNATLKAQEADQKAQYKGVLDQSFKFLQSANEDEMTKFVDQYPDAAREMAPALSKRLTDLAESRAMLPLLPEHMQQDVVDERGTPIPHKLNAKLKEFNNAFEGPLGKVENLQTKRELAGLAEQWVKLPAPSGERGKRDEVADTARTTLAESITAALGEKEVVSDAIIRSIARESRHFKAPPSTKDEIKEYLRREAMGDPAP